MVNLEELAHIVGGVLMNTSASSATRINFDTRSLQKGELFWALKGEKFDGNAFLDEALKKGAAAVVTERLSWKGPAILVADTYEALVRYAKHKRENFRGTVIAITGSNGKTTTRRYVSQLLRKRYSVFEPSGNFNNQFGIPMTLANLESADYLVLELGGAKLGDISFLSKIVKPDVGVITSIGRTHLEFLGEEENVLRMKLEILTGMEQGKLLVNRDSALLSALPKELEGNTIYGFSMENREADFLLQGNTLHTPKGDYGISVVSDDLINQSQLGMALSALVLAGVDIRELSGAALRPVRGRFEILEWGHSVIINDSYNANPDSMIYGLTQLKRLKQRYADRKLVLVLGDMLELGQNALNLHKEILPYVNELKPDAVILIGDIITRLNPVTPSLVKIKSVNELKPIFDSVLAEGSLVYVKASNGVGLYEFLNNIIGEKDALPSVVSIT